MRLNHIGVWFLSITILASACVCVSPLDTAEAQNAVEDHRKRHLERLQRRQEGGENGGQGYVQRQRGQQLRREYTGVAKETCAVDRESDAYRHNAYIVSDADKLKRDLEVMSNGSYRPYVSDNQIAEAKEQLAALPSTKGSVVTKPQFIDLYHLCEKQTKSLIEGEFALRRNDASLRVAGDICADEPRIVFVDYRPNDHGTDWLEPSNFQQAAQHGYYRGSSRLYPQFYMRGVGVNTVERGILEALAIIKMQCSSLPQTIDIEGRLPEKKTSSKDHSKAKFQTVYRGKLKVGKDPIELVHENEQHAALYREYDRFRDGEVDRRAAEQAKQHEQFSLGAAMIILGIALSAGSQPCNPVTMQNVPGYSQPRLVYQQC